MDKNILVIGGSYFLGRVFIEELLKLDEGYRLYVMNRGRIPLRKEGITEIVCDRRDPARMKKVLPKLNWNLVVDFCGYTPDDISMIFEALGQAGAGQYVFISTASVYGPSSELPITEDGPLLKGPGPEPGPMTRYAYDKLLAEDALRKAATAKGTAFTIFRPAFIYGKYNYAPRESFFFDLLHAGKPVPIPAEGLPLFSFVSVWDCAEMIIRSLGSEKMFGRAFNLAAPELISYPRIAEELGRLEPENFRERTVSRQEIDAEEIPLPFPLDEHLVYDGTAAAAAAGAGYTPFREGFTLTCELYKIGKGWN